VVLPLVVLAFAVVRSPQPGAPAAAATAPAPAAAPLAGPTAAVTDDPAARVQRLDGAVAVAAMAGGNQDGRQVVVAGGVPWVLNRDLDQVDRLGGTELTAVLRRGQAVGDAVVGEIEDLVWVPGGSDAAERLLVLDAAGALWQVTGAAAPIAVPRAERPAWQSVTRAGGFGGNLYALDRSVGQIYRYSPDADGGYAAAGRDWLTDPVAMADVVDVTIDGTVYLLFKDGTVRQFADGLPTRFALAAVPEGFSRGHTFQASQNLNRQSLLVTDPANGRLLVFGADGSFQQQLLFPPQVTGTDEAARAGRLRDLHDAWWDEAGGMLYVAAGSWLYRAPYGGPG